MIAILTLAALITAFLIASALNRSGADISNERLDRTTSALRQAKAALIAYAASEQWQNQGGVTPFQPGALPCPDRDNDGIAEDHEVPQKPCNTSLKRIGRFPWKTIGADDLRDASGESLWYAVSASFLKNTPLYTNVINSDTLGQLTVNGAGPANNVVAIVFAPGETIQGQLRSPANLNDPASYLEQFDALTYATFTSTASPSAINNDRLLIITQADLMAAVEPIVAANIQRDVKPLLQDYVAKWGAYPFAMPFVSPPAAQGTYVGLPTPPAPSPGTTQGLLPVTNTVTLTWQGPTVSQIGGTGFPTVTSASCSISSNTVTCTVAYDALPGHDDRQARPDILLTVFLQNASVTFADALAPSAENLAMRDGWGNVASSQGSPYGYWSTSGSYIPTQQFVAQANGGGTLSYTGRLQNAHDMNYQAVITIALPAPSYLPRLTNSSPTNPNIDWFLSNQWYRQTYYAISSGWVPGGSGGCNPTVSIAPPCLTVKNLATPTNNKEAILIFAGRALGGQTHPSGTLANYLEGENATPADLIFEHRAGAPTTINDRVVVVSP